jgi:hypothetical protein
MASIDLFRIIDDRDRTDLRPVQVVREENVSCGSRRHSISRVRPSQRVRIRSAPIKP